MRNGAQFKAQIFPEDARMIVRQADALSCRLISRNLSFGVPE